MEMSRCAGFVKMHWAALWLSTCKYVELAHMVKIWAIFFSQAEEQMIVFEPPTLVQQ